MREVTSEEQYCQKIFTISLNISYLQYFQINFQTILKCRLYNLEIVCILSSVCSVIMAEQKKKLAKRRLVKAEPLPISKMENDCMNDMARWWSF